MPPPEAVAGTYTGLDGKKIKVAALSDEDRLTLVRWVDLGCPIDLTYDDSKLTRFVIFPTPLAAQSTPSSLLLDTKFRAADVQDLEVEPRHSAWSESTQVKDACSNRSVPVQIVSPRSPRHCTQPGPQRWRNLSESLAFSPLPNRLRKSFGYNFF